MKHLIPPTGRRTRQAILLSALLAAAASAQAAQTGSGVDIENQATLEYSVGNVPQTDILSDADPVTPGMQKTTFKVDKKVDVSVATADIEYMFVVPGANAAPETYAATLKVLTFNVTNEGNDPQKIYLTASQTGVTDPFGGTDTFDSGTCETYVEEGGVDGFDSTDVRTTSIASLGSDAIAKVYVVCSVPGTQVNNDIAAVALTASVGAVGGGSAYAAGDQDTGADDPTAVQIVFADGDGPYDNDRDAAYSDESAYKVQTATLTVTKTATTICDPANGSSDPKAIPGAHVQYEIRIANSGSNSAVLTTLTDALQAVNTAIDPDLKTAATSCASAASAAGSGFRISCTSGLRACATTPTYFTTDNDADGIDHDGSATGGAVTVNFATALAGALDGGSGDADYNDGELKTGESVTVRFNIVIQ